MSYVETPEDATPLAHATISYLGPVAPHWEIRGHFGDPKMIDAFWTRVTARLLLLPRHDPQFRRNKERVNRDAERELITLDWDLGDEEPARKGPSRSAAAKKPAQAPVVEEVEAPVAEAEAPVAEELAPSEAVSGEVASTEPASSEVTPSEVTPSEDQEVADTGD